MNEKNNLSELSNEKLISKKKSYKTFMIMFGVIFVILILALLYGQFYKNHKFFTFQNISVIVLIFMFAAINYNNIQKINKELESRNKN